MVRDGWVSSVLAIVSGLSLSPLFVQLMLTHDEQQQPLVAVSSQNSYEQYIQNYAAQQVGDDDTNLCCTASMPDLCRRMRSKLMQCMWQVSPGMGLMCQGEERTKEIIIGTLLQGAEEVRSQ